MTESLRLHLDENVNPAIARGLRQRGIDVTTSQEANLLGVSDLEQLAYARREGRVIFTEDADFLMLAASQSDHAGIVYCRKGTRSIGYLVEGLALVHGAMTSGEMAGHVEYL